MTEIVTDRDRRNELARRIFKELASKPDDLLAVTNEDGARPLVFALDHELLSEVMQRVENAGGAANTFIEDAGGDLTLAAFRLAKDPSEDRENLGAEPIHQDITIGMFVAVMRTYEQGVTARIRLPRHNSDVSDIHENVLTLR